LEYEADERGMAIMQRAGFDTKAPLRWMAREIYMSSDPAFLQVWQRYMEGHPPWTDRADHLRVYKEQVLDKGPFLAFVRDNALWISKWDGTEQRKTSLSSETIGQPVWSPRGDALAVESGGNIYLVRAADLGVIQLTGSGKAHDPVWMPGADRVLCASQGDIYLVGADGRERKRLTNMGDCGSPAPSPDGSLVAYGSPNAPDGGDPHHKGVWVVSPTGGAPRALIQGSALHGLCCAVWRFSPEGTEVAFCDAGYDCGADWVVSLGGQSPSVLIGESGSGTPPGAWAPGGRRWLGADCGPDGQTRFRLCTVDLLHRRLDELAVWGGEQPWDWKPDRTWTRLALVAPATTTDDRQSLLVVDYPSLARGSVVARVPEGAGLIGWSPLGSDILLFAHSGGPDGYVLLVPSVSGPSRRLIEKASWGVVLSEPWPYVL
jgi:hypothetical protein